MTENTRNVTNYIKHHENVKKTRGAKMKLDELENTLLDQIEKLNDDSLADDPEKAQMMIDKSKVMSDLAGRVNEMNRLKLDIYKEANTNGGMYERFLGIEEK